MIATSPALPRLVLRVKSEFIEMPGLRLMPGEAARLWAVDAGLSTRILDDLTVDGFLYRTQDGAYLRADEA